jgi:hypothetical protein
MKKEQLIFVRGKWEIARIEINDATGVRQWIRRDLSWICKEGDEAARMDLPARPTTQGE